jgi:hypothetical protein
MKSQFPLPLHIISFFGRKADFARAIGRSPAFVTHVVSGERNLTATMCVAVELASHGKFLRQTLRPDLFGGQSEIILHNIPTPKPRVATVWERFWSKVDKSNDCWVWTGCKNKKGYGVAGSGIIGGSKRAHRACWEYCNGKIPDGLGVLHKCDNPPCVNPEHLFLGTNQDNVDDRERKGRASNHLKGCAGEANGLAKLDEQEVIWIKRLLATGKMSHRAIARIFSVTAANISGIARGKTWGHLTP